MSATWQPSAVRRQGHGRPRQGATDAEVQQSLTGRRGALLEPSGVLGLTLGSSWGMRHQGNSRPDIALAIGISHWVNTPLAPSPVALFHPFHEAARRCNAP